MAEGGLTSKFYTWSSNELFLDLNTPSGSAIHQRFRVIFEKLVHITCFYDCILPRGIAQKLPSERACAFNSSHRISPIYPWCRRQVSRRHWEDDIKGWEITCWLGPSLRLSQAGRLCWATLAHHFYLQLYSYTVRLHWPIF